jgi:hypothetical protein
MYTEVTNIPIQLSSEESISYTAFADRDFADEIILLSNKGNFYRKNLGNGHQNLVSNLGALVNLNQPVGLYTYRNYLAIVNQRGRHGLVINLIDNTIVLQLLRGEYQVEHCSFPIAFYSRENQVYLIHGTDWNRLDITCLSTGKQLTERVVQYDKQKPINYLDYFHSSLIVSPDELSFISNGWVWQPFDVMLLWKIQDFLHQYELKNYCLSFLETSGYNWDRPLCWIDNQTIEYGLNSMEGTTLEEGQAPLSDIIIQRTDDNTILEKVPFDGLYVNTYGEVKGTLEYDRKLNAFIGYHKYTGVTVTDRNGGVLYKDIQLKPERYSTQWGALIVIKGRHEIDIVSLHHHS